MVIDTSALLAILQDEPERRSFNEAIEAAEARALSSASYLETAIILESRYGAEGVRDLDHFIAVAQFVLEPVTAEQARLAREAWRQYGTARHPDGLTFGDTFAYALSRTLGQPLLFKDPAFVRTDVECHPASRPALAQ